MFEVVVVDDGSRDDTAAVLTSLAATSTVPLRSLVRRESGGPAAARNDGWRATRASLVAFTDDDCVPAPGWLQALVDALADADVVQGRTVPDPGQSDRLGPFSRTIDAPEMDGLFRTCNAGYRREWLERLGGFDVALRRSAEDTDLARRAIKDGADAAFAPAALVHHDVRPSSWWAELRGAPRWAGIALAVRRHPELRERFHRRVFWRRAHQPVIVALGGFAVAAVLHSPWSAVAAAAGLLPYVDHRLRVGPLPHTTAAQRVRLLPAAFAVDTTETLVLLTGSVRYRTLVV